MNGPANGRNALVLYGTETGTAQDLAEELGRVAERLRFSTSIAELDTVPITLLSSYTITIFVISTTGQGEFPSNARRFWTNLLKKKLSVTFLQDLPFFVVGLGDTSYPKFNWAARKLGKRLKQLGATEVIASCEADEQGEDSTYGAFLAWLPLFKAALLQGFPIPDGLKPIPDEQPLPSKWVLGCASENAKGHSLDSFGMSEPKVIVEGTKRMNVEVPFSHVDHDDRQIPDAFQVCLEENKRATPSSHWQDVRLLTLTTKQSIDYLPGDALSILPKNFPEDVNSLINLMDWTAIADTPITLVPTSKSANFANDSLSPIPHPSSASSALTLRALLACYLDITSIPHRSAFTTLSRYTTNLTHRGRLLEFTLPQYLDEYYDYATRPRRSILEILQEFNSVKIPWQEAVNVFPILRGRQFSIASGGKLRTLPDGATGTRFELLVAVVKYKTVIKKIRQGVCTRYLAALAPGSTLNVVHRTEGRFSAKKQKPKPMRIGSNFATQVGWEMTAKLLIGAGTGIAPLRAVILDDEERARKMGWKPPDWQPPDWHPHPPLTALFFGSRNRANDFFFADEWAAKVADTSTQNGRAGEDGGEGESEKEGAKKERFKLVTAFSRDQNTKIYLQDRLREHADLVFDLLVNRNATVVVSGSSGAMPKAVRQALVDVLVRGKDGRGVGRSKPGVDTKGEEAEAEAAPSSVLLSAVKGDREQQEVSQRKEANGWTQQEAEGYLDGMEKTRRYLQETW